MSKANPRTLVLLTCGHFAYWPHDAVFNDARTCHSCRDVATMVQWWDEEWNARCTVCRWSRFYGVDESTCRREAAAHAHRATAQLVSTEPELRPGKTGEPDDGQLVLDLYPTPEDEPPF